MNPLSNNSSKKITKKSFLFIWLFSSVLASPVLFLHRFEFAVDRVHGEKPFCTTIGTTKTKFFMDLQTFKVEKVVKRDEIQLLDKFGIKEFMWMLFFVQYVFPLIILAVCYLKISVKLWTRQIPGNQQGWKSTFWESDP